VGRRRGKTTIPIGGRVGEPSGLRSGKVPAEETWRSLKKEGT